MRGYNTELREVINALRYVVRSECSWRMLPKEFGPWQIIYWWFRRLMRSFLFSTILNICIILAMFRCGKK
ncbi:MAG: transposase [Sutterella sp.]|nr:transposase [Sutterella sp.]